MPRVRWPKSAKAEGELIARDQELTVRSARAHLDGAMAKAYPDKGRFKIPHVETGDVRPTPAQLLKVSLARVVATGANESLSALGDRSLQCSNQKWFTRPRGSES